ncbi:hypothetical protein OROMI_010482 [Orobanche minor]
MPKIFALIEPKVTLNNSYFCRLFGYDKVISNVNNHIWIFSDVGIDITVLFDSDQLLLTRVISNEFSDCFFLSLVYGKNNKIERRVLCNDLISISQNISPWMVRGDFNIVLYSHEKKGTSHLSSPKWRNLGMLSLNAISWTVDMWDPPSRGIVISYGKGWTGFFSRPFGSASFPEVVSSTSLGTHRTITLFYAHSWSIPSPFSGLLKLSKKLARLKLTLKEWNKITFGNILQNVEMAQKGVAEAEGKFDSDPTLPNMVQLKKANAELNLISAMEESFWKQKARVKKGIKT